MKILSISGKAGRCLNLHKEMGFHAMCSKCRSTNVEIIELENCKCKCRAPIHFKKVCKDCGLKTILHRHVFNETGTKGFIGA